MEENEAPGKKLRILYSIGFYVGPALLFARSPLNFFAYVAV